MANTLAVLAAFLFVPVGQAAERSSVVSCWCAKEMCTEVLGLAKSPSGDKKPGFLPVTNDQVLKKFAAGTYSVCVHRGPLCVPDYHAIWKAFGQDQRLDSIVMGEYVVHVIVNARNPIRTLKIEELAGIYRGQILDWKKLQKAKSGPIHIFSPPFVDTAYHIVHLNALQGSLLSRCCVMISLQLVLCL